jgi:hypothetical protein
MEKMLSPGQQLWLDVGHLVHDQVPDSDGHTLPPDTMTGSYELRDLDHALVGSLYEGKLVIDKTYGHAAYGCGSCCGYYGTKLTPSPFSGPPGIDNNDVIQATEQCGGYIDDVTYGGYDWHSSNTAVATLPNRTLHTVAHGTATGSAAITLQSDKHSPQCPNLTWGPTQPVNVDPYQVEPIDTASEGPAQCTKSGQSGWVRNVTNQVQYVTGAAYAVSGLPVADSISVGNPNALGISGKQEGQAPTTGHGSFPDTYYVCSTACPGSGESDAAQSWVVAGIPLLHVDYLVYKCASITIEAQRHRDTEKNNC